MKLLLLIGAGALTVVLIIAALLAIWLLYLEGLEFWLRRYFVVGKVKIYKKNNGDILVSYMWRSLDAQPTAYSAEAILARPQEITFAPEVFENAFIQFCEAYQEGKL